MKRLLARLRGTSEKQFEHAPKDAQEKIINENAATQAWMRPGIGRAAAVGWLLDTPKAHFIWGAPRRISRDDPTPRHAKSVSFCPAVNDHDSRMWDIPCPIDVRLGFRRDAEGKPSLVDVDGDRSSIRGKLLSQMVTMVAEKEWRHPDRPIIQIHTPYIFLSDEPVWMMQMPPISSYRREQWPGLIIGGRLPIHIWPRPMMWAFEWWDTERSLSLTRGEPWFHIRFETHDPKRHIRLIEAELTSELREYLNGISSVANYVDKTFSLFKIAQERRPMQLLVSKDRSSQNRHAEDKPPPPSR